jgi:hypothetical protein
MANPKYIGDAGPDGTILGRSASDLLSFHGKEPAVDQAAAITTPTDLATSITAITAILVALREKGLIAT